MQIKKLFKPTKIIAVLDQRSLSATISGFGCVYLNSIRGSEREAAARLLDAHVRSRVHYECPIAPYRSGMLITKGELESIVKAVGGELNRNIRLAEREHRQHEASTIKLAKKIGLYPRNGARRKVNDRSH